MFLLAMEVPPSCRRQPHTHEDVLAPVFSPPMKDAFRQVNANELNAIRVEVNASEPAPADLAALNIASELMRQGEIVLVAQGEDRYYFAAAEEDASARAS